MVSQTIFQKLTIIIVGNLTKIYVDAKLISIEAIIKERSSSYPKLWGKAV